MKKIFLIISNNFSLSIYPKMFDIYCFSSVSCRLHKGTRSTSMLSHTVWYLLFQLSVLQASQGHEIYQHAITYSLISTVSAQCPAGFTRAGDLPACYHLQSDIYCFSSVSCRLYKGRKSTSMLSHTVRHWEELHRVWSTLPEAAQAEPPSDGRHGREEVPPGDETQDTRWEDVQRFSSTAGSAYNEVGYNGSRLYVASYFLPSANEVCKGNVFTGVCLPTGGRRGCLPSRVSAPGSLSRGVCPGVSV